jgi:hypothetical protein
MSELERYEAHVTKLRGGAPTGSGVWLRKLVLPHAQARRVLRLLDQANIDASTLFPSYDGVVRSLEEHALTRSRARPRA